MPPVAVLISAAEGSFVASDPETGTTTQGDSVTETISNLREATDCSPPSKVRLMPKLTFISSPHQ